MTSPRTAAQADSLARDAWEVADADGRRRIEDAWVSMIAGPDEARARWALEQCYHAYAGPLTAYGRLSIRHASADGLDLVHTVYLAIWRERRRFSVRTTLRAYLYGAMRNGVLKALAHQRVVGLAATEASYLDGPLAMAAGAVGPTEAVERREITDQFVAALATLPTRTRVVALLVLAHGLERAEVADVLGVSVALVKKELGHARPILRARLAPFGPTLADG